MEDYLTTGIACTWWGFVLTCRSGHSSSQRLSQDISLWSNCWDLELNPRRTWQAWLWMLMDPCWATQFVRTWRNFRKRSLKKTSSMLTGSSTAAGPSQHTCWASAHAWFSAGARGNMVTGANCTKGSWAPRIFSCPKASLCIPTATILPSTQLALWASWLATQWALQLWDELFARSFWPEASWTKGVSLAISRSRRQHDVAQSFEKWRCSCHKSSCSESPFDMRVW